MNISYNWLKQYINIDIPAEETAKILTSIGLEVGSVEHIQNIKGGLEGLVVGEVLTCIEHPNSDHLHLTTVNIGTGEELKIVCGAPNVAAGQKVIVAPIGTVLYSGEENFTIKRSKIRGEESFGMLCAEDEIGIGNSHAGIIVLPPDVPVGTLAKEYYKVENDTVIEVDITPNRIDAASHFGVARDLAAYCALYRPEVKLKPYPVDNFKVDNNDFSIPVSVENATACPRYSALTLSGVTVKESPEWLKNYFKTVGLRSINNVVDATNFVLHAMGQPIHAFDADKIAGKQVIVKNLPEGTPFVTLDGVERKLSADDLMICDTEGGMCIGGVFGGLHSAVTEATTNIFLESAYFNPVSIRKTARRHGLNTDASFRYERGCDPNNTLYILKFATLFIQHVAGGKVSSNIVDIYPAPIARKEVVVSYQKINSLIGKDIDKATIKTILTALEVDIQSENDTELKLSIPSYRVDVERDVDVIEDLLRIFGYNNVQPDTSVKSSISYFSKPDSHKLQNLVAEQLTACGFNEILNNSLSKASYYEKGESYRAENCVRLLNPLSNDLSVMRQTLLFGGLESIAYNRNRKNADLKFYEFGNCYRFDPARHAELISAHNDASNKNYLAPYGEDFFLGLWITGNKAAQSWVRADEKTTVFELKAYLENILKRLGLGVKSFVVENFSNENIEQGVKLFNRKGKELANYGIVNRKLLKEFDINAEVFYAELNWNAVLKIAAKQRVAATDIPKFPEVSRDLALLLDKSVEFASIEKIAFESERKLLKSVSLFDVYEGKNIEAGKKSYAVNFVLRDDEKTLTDKQIDAIMNKIQHKLEETGAKLR
ncbi:MAG: phenylalanine--tRNA ligase subunit beta [Prevotellaceae bacterium]|jgi:phenylalanyl-tRNA synthetase beta chain|nr:phenylalanine--tRNA ligase subunit beta [Prevotellaceae bacterium]